jgi:hypothetical protein
VQKLHFFERFFGAMKECWDEMEYSIESGLFRCVFMPKFV